MKNNYCVIMAGGVGSRFWPISTEAIPKQFLDILNTGKSLIQITYQRALSFFHQSNIFIVTHQKYSNLVQEHLPELEKKNLLIEPERKNTAACILFSMMHISSLNSQSKVLVMPSDHIIFKEIEFIKAVSLLLEKMEEEVIYTLGIEPTRPDTGYGYIEFQNKEKSPIKKVLSFKEKPNKELAQSYLEKKTYCWNAGIFLWSTNSILSVFKNYMPVMYDLFFTLVSEDKMMLEYRQKIKWIYSQCESISVDNAILEKYNKVKMLQVDIGWSDLGTWQSLYQILDKDNYLNSISTVNDKVVVKKSKDNLIKNFQVEKKILIQGVEGLFIVNTPDSLLICDKNQEQEIKETIEENKNKLK